MNKVKKLTNHVTKHISKFYKKYISETLPLDERFANIFLIGGSVTGFVSTVVLKIISMPWTAILFSFILSLIMSAMFLAAQFTKKHNLVLKITLLIMNFVFLPPIFLSTGGISGGTGGYFILGIVCTSFMFSGIKVGVLVALEVVLDILLILWSYVLSDYMVSLVENIPYKYLLIPMNVLISSMAIGTTAKLFFEQYKQEKNKRDRLISTLEDLTVRDPLTGLYNRAYFMDFLEKQIKIAQKKEMTFSIVMFDLDFFKEINDKHGHMLGDKVLIEVASVLNSSVQSGDIVSRYGGEEFIAVLLDRDKETAFIKSDQIRAKIEKIRLIDGFYIPITISGGVAEYRNVLSIESLLSEADKNLYIAKNSGRNKICKSELEFVDGIY